MKMIKYYHELKQMVFLLLFEKLVKLENLFLIIILFQIHLFAIYKSTFPSLNLSFSYAYLYQRVMAWVSNCNFQSKVQENHSFISVSYPL